MCFLCRFCCLLFYCLPCGAPPRRGPRPPRGRPWTATFVSFKLSCLLSIVLCLSLLCVLFVFFVSLQRPLGRGVCGRRLPRATEAYAPTPFCTGSISCTASVTMMCIIISSIIDIIIIISSRSNIIITLPLHRRTAPPPGA